ncbi:hypothetical protein B0T10DRAFT_609761 [Thelonectria olida]|uniref:Uncharacterized protein n=1 Tax=Thelonectria olida TaxID=1576542 RepID=A0A9P8VXX4_9HYPO|nr:hypothetical protein B0T10DRAFT_609761 [Thelonectria olida]
MAEPFSINNSPSSEYQWRRMLLDTPAPRLKRIHLHDPVDPRGDRHEGFTGPFASSPQKSFRNGGSKEDAGLSSREWNEWDELEESSLPRYFWMQPLDAAGSAPWVSPQGSRYRTSTELWVDDYLNGVRTPKPPTELLHSGDRWTEAFVRKRMRTITKLFEGLRSINQIAYILIADVPHKTNWACMAHVPKESPLWEDWKISSTKCLEANRTSRLLSRPSGIKVASVGRREFGLAVDCTFVHGPPASDSSKKET